MPWQTSLPIVAEVLSEFPHMTFDRAIQDTFPLYLHGLRAAPKRDTAPDTTLADLKSVVSAIVDEKNARLEKKLDDIGNKVPTDLRLFSQTIRNDIRGDVNSIVTDSQRQIDRSLHQQLDANNSELKVVVQQVGSMKDTMDTRLGNTKSNTERGVSSERFLRGVLEGQYPQGTVVSTGEQTKCAADLIFHNPGKPSILFENKVYGGTVPISQVDKFVRDVELNKMCGIFVSQESDIQGVNDGEIKYHGGFPCVYLHNVQQSPTILTRAVQTIYALYALNMTMIKKEYDLMQNLAEKEQQLDRKRQRLERSVDDDISATDDPTISAAIDAVASGVFVPDEMVDEVCTALRWKFKKYRADIKDHEARIVAHQTAVIALNTELQHLAPLMAFVQQHRPDEFIPPAAVIVAPPAAKIALTNIGAPGEHRCSKCHKVFGNAHGFAIHQARCQKK